MLSTYMNTSAPSKINALYFSVFFTFSSLFVKFLHVISKPNFIRYSSSYECNSLFVFSII
jgi:hypothetical protein